MRKPNLCSVIHAAILITGIATITPQELRGQGPPLDWGATQSFQYNVESIIFEGVTRNVKVVFSVTDPTNGNTPYDIKTDAAFVPPARLGIDIGWNTAEFVNTGSAGEQLPDLPRFWMNSTPPTPGGLGAAYPIQVNALASSQPCSAADCPGVPDLTLRFWVSSTLPLAAAGTGSVAIEGHPVTLAGANVPVKSVFEDFPITDAMAVGRRQVVDIAKCQGCHNGVVVPRLSLHGANRNEELGVCVVCHNPNQTDIPYRSFGSEESVDFKRMIHGIHAGEERRNPLVIIGFRGSVNDYSHVRFPAELKNCLNCHIEIGGRGTFELPLMPTVVGSTVDTGSMVQPPGFVDTDPSNDLKITPTASVCSSCHDDRETKWHMESRGASFGIPQDILMAGGNNERCVNCHGPGKEKDVRKVHGVGGRDDDHDREDGDHHEDDRDEEEDEDDHDHERDRH